MARFGASARRAIRRYLRAQGQTQTWLAPRLGITLTGLNDILTGRRQPSPELARKLADETGEPFATFRPDIAELVGVTHEASSR